MRKLIRFLLWLTAGAVLFFSVFKLGGYIKESSTSKSLNKTLAEEAVIIKNTDESTDKSEFKNNNNDADEELIPKETAPIEVDFDLLLKTNADVIGWLYCKDTPISLPIVKGEDNSYYMHRLIDGTKNSSGTLFVDYRNAGDFSDRNTIVFGHNMKNKGMFGTLSNYKEQLYFDEHPVMWLLTPKTGYKVELIAGYVTKSTAYIYSFGQEDNDILAMVEQAIGQSTFVSDFQINSDDRFVTLSTCSYEFDNARYVLIGRLKPLE